MATKDTPQHFPLHLLNLSSQQWNKPSEKKSHTKHRQFFTYGSQVTVDIKPFDHSSRMPRCLLCSPNNLNSSSIYFCLIIWLLFNQPHLCRSPVGAFLHSFPFVHTPFRFASCFSFSLGQVIQCLLMIDFVFTVFTCIIA